MSWLARSIANSLRIDDDDNDNIIDGDNRLPSAALDNDVEEEEEDDPSGNRQQRGVKEDLSEFKETLTRQIWGVASFLAPPAQLNNHNRILDFEADSDDAVAAADFGGRNDRGGGGGYWDLGNSLPYRLEDQIGGAVGITEESLAFASNIAHHPETWLDFPLSEEDDHIDGMCFHARKILLAKLNFESFFL